MNLTEKPSQTTTKSKINIITPPNKLGHRPSNDRIPPISLYSNTYKITCMKKFKPPISPPATNKNNP
jgi:hypothetical protein